MRFVENDWSGPERVIPDNLDKIRQNSVFNKKCSDDEASIYLSSGYLRLHCSYITVNDNIVLICLQLSFFGCEGFSMN